MLYKSNNNLTNKIEEFVAKSQSLKIFVPYVKLDSLKYLLNNFNNCILLVVRWELRDLIQGSSDLEVYHYCKEKGIALYRNPKIHLKAFLNDSGNCLLGSANISSRALNIPECKNYNYELCTEVADLEITDKIYFEWILNDSVLITDSIFERIRTQLSAIEPYEFPKMDFKIPDAPIDSHYLISSLPMSSTVETFILNYLQPGIHTKLDTDCFIHDLILYSIPLGLQVDELVNSLKTNFFTHPFIKEFVHYLETKGPMYFGTVKDWIHQRCTNVPLPRKWEITTNIQILYNWIAELGDGRYVIDRPNHSERLSYVGI